MKPIPQLKSKLPVLGIVAAAVLLARILELPCFFPEYLGFPCPGCGMTRAILCALRLDLAAAFSYHWMFWSAPLLLLIFLLDGKLFRKKLWNHLLLWGLGLGFLANWIDSLFFR